LAAPYPGVRIAGVERTDNPNYLFVNLTIDKQARPGELQLQFRRGKETLASHRYRLQARRRGSAQRRSFDAADAIYLLMPDRFASAGAANDQAGMLEGADRANPVKRHGGDLAGMRGQLDYISKLGFTM